MRGIDEVPVSAWLAAHVEGLEPPFRFELIAGGHSNLTYRVVDSTGRAVVLRRPPMGHVLATAHDMAREHRIISAVRTAGVPVAPALGLCTDETVNGAPFYVMGFVEGMVLDNAEKAATLAPAVRAAAGRNLIDVLAHLHDVDVDSIGLGDLSKRDGYVERQLKRWSKQWEGSKTRELPAIEEVERLLRLNVPVQLGVSVVHGDYRFGNVLTDPQTGAINGVLDWELCTLGDRLADLGWMLVYWSDGDGASGRANDPTGAGGFITKAEMVERYAAASGRDVSGIDYYVAFSAWRLAVISEGVYARYLHGAMADETVDISTFKAGTDALAEQALAAAQRIASTS